MADMKAWVVVLSDEDGDKFHYTVAAVSDAEAIELAMNQHAKHHDNHELECVYVYPIEAVEGQSDTVYLIKLAPVMARKVRYVKLTRMRCGESEAYTDLLEVDDSIKDAETAIRTAIKEFLSTPDGMDAMVDSCDDFNWGDAIMYVPDEIWAKHGLRIIPEPMYVSIYVSQDEVLGSLENYGQGDNPGI